MRDSFIFFRSFYEAIKDLPRDVQGEIYTAIMEYGLYGKETEQLKPIARSIFILIKPVLDAGLTRQDNSRKGGAPKGVCNNPNGRGGKPRTNQEQTENKLKTNQEQTENKLFKDKDKDWDKDKEKDYDMDNPKQTSRFFPPSVGDVRAYCQERGNNVDAERFINHYTSNGWMVGKNKMKDWKAAVRTWEKGSEEKKLSKPSNLGVGEFMDGDRRTYGSGAITIPPEAPPRPSLGHAWNPSTAQWIIY